MASIESTINEFNIKIKEYVESIKKIKSDLQGRYDTYKKGYEENSQILNIFEGNLRDSLLDQLNKIQRFSLEDIGSFENDLKGAYNKNYDAEPVYNEIEKELDEFIRSDYNNLEELPQNAVEVTILDTISAPIKESEAILKREYDLSNSKNYIKVPKTSNIRCIEFGISFAQFNLSHFEDHIKKNGSKISLDNTINFENDERIIRRYYRGDIFIVDAQSSKPIIKAFLLIPDNESMGKMKCGPEIELRFFTDPQYIYILPVSFRPYRMDWKEIHFGNDVEIFDMFNPKKVIDPKVLFYCHAYFSDITKQKLVDDSENTHAIGELINMCHIYSDEELKTIGFLNLHTLLMNFVREGYIQLSKEVENKLNDIHPFIDETIKNDKITNERNFMIELYKKHVVAFIKKTSGTLINNLKEIPESKIEIKPLKDGFYKYYNFLNGREEDSDIRFIDNSVQTHEFFPNELQMIDFSKTTKEELFKQCTGKVRNLYEPRLTNMMRFVNIHRKGPNQYSGGDYPISTNCMNRNLQNKFCGVDESIFTQFIDMKDNEHSHLTRFGFGTSDIIESRLTKIARNHNLLSIERNNQGQVVAFYGKTHDSVNSKILKYNIMPMDNCNQTFKEIFEMIEYRYCYGVKYLRRIDAYMLFLKDHIMVIYLKNDTEPMRSIVYKADPKDFFKKPYEVETFTIRNTYDTNITTMNAYTRLHFADYIGDKLVFLINDVLFEFDEVTNEMKKYYIREEDDKVVNRDFIDDDIYIQSVFFANGRYYVCVHNIGIYEIIETNKYRIYKQFKKEKNEVSSVVFNDPFNPDKLVIIENRLIRSIENSNDTKVYYECTLTFNATINNILKENEPHVHYTKTKQTITKNGYAKIIKDKDSIANISKDIWNYMPHFAYTIDRIDKRIYVANEYMIFKFDYLVKKNVKNFMTINREISRIFENERIRRMSYNESGNELDQKSIPYRITARLSKEINKKDSKKDNNVPVTFDIYERALYTLTESGFETIINHPYLEKDKGIRFYDFEACCFGVFAIDTADRREVFFGRVHDDTFGSHFGNSKTDIFKPSAFHTEKDSIGFVKLHFPMGISKFIANYIPEKDTMTHALFYGLDGNLYGIFSYEKDSGSCKVERVLEVSRVFVKNNKDIKHFNIDYCIDHYLIDFDTKSIFVFDSVVDNKYYLRLIDDQPDLFDTIINKRIEYFNKIFYKDDVIKITSYKDFFNERLHDFKIFIDRSGKQYAIIKKLHLGKAEFYFAYIDESGEVQYSDEHRFTIYEPPITILSSYYTVILFKNNIALCIYGNCSCFASNKMYTDAKNELVAYKPIIGDESLYEDLGAYTIESAAFDDVSTVLLCKHKRTNKKEIFVSSGLIETNVIDPYTNKPIKAVTSLCNTHEMYTGLMENYFQIGKLLAYKREDDEQDGFEEINKDEIKEITISNHRIVMSRNDNEYIYISSFDIDKHKTIDEFRKNINLFMKSVHQPTVRQKPEIYKSIRIDDTFIVLLKVLPILGNPVLINEALIFHSKKTKRKIFGDVDNMIVTVQNEAPHIFKALNYKYEVTSKPEDTAGYAHIAPNFNGSFAFCGNPNKKGDFRISSIGDNTYYRLGHEDTSIINEYKELPIDYDNYSLVPQEHVCYNEYSSIIVLKDEIINKYVLLFMGTNKYNKLFNLKKNGIYKKPTVIDKQFDNIVVPFYTKERFVYLTDGVFTSIDYNNGMTFTVKAMNNTKIESLLYDSTRDVIIGLTKDKYLFEYIPTKNKVQTIASDIVKFYNNEQKHILKVCDSKNKVGTFYFGDLLLNFITKLKNCGLGIELTSLIDPKTKKINFINPFNEFVDYTYIEGDYKLPFTAMHVVLDQRSHKYKNRVFKSVMYATPSLINSESYSILKDMDLNMDNITSLIHYANHVREDIGVYPILSEFDEQYRHQHKMSLLTENNYRGDFDVEYVKLEIFPHKVKSNDLVPIEEVLPTDKNPYNQ